jgi:hypothetical protein
MVQIAKKIVPVAPVEKRVCHISDQFTLVMTANEYLTVMVLLGCLNGGNRELTEMFLKMTTYVEQELQLPLASKMVDYREMKTKLKDDRISFMA